MNESGMNEPVDLTAARNTVAQLGGFAPRRHIFLCVDPDKDKCCPRAVGQESWAFLKRRLGELGLGGAAGVLRSKAGCLRVCAAGPVAVVYPEAVWYSFVDNHDIDEIVESHLKNGRVVERLLIPGDVGR